MPFRPISEFRKNVYDVVLPLTAAIARLYGIRESDGAYPLGTFYTKHIDIRVWVHVGGIWYQPLNPDKVASRRIGEERIEQFAEGIVSGREVPLNDGSMVTWEEIPDSEAQLLPLQQ